MPPQPGRTLRALAVAGLTVLCAGLVVACGDSFGPRVPAELRILTGDSVSATVGTALGDSLTVRVLNERGRALEGVLVRWAAVSGGGSVQPESTMTGATGEARALWSLGRTAGEQRASATVAGLPPAAFTATASAGAPVTLVTVRGDLQSATVGTALADSLAVRASDVFGNPVSDVTITWIVTMGGGSVSPVASTTGADGQARTSMIVGTIAQPNVVYASPGGFSGVEFTATGTAGAAATVATVGGDGQTAAANWTVPDSLVAKVVDQYGNPVPGVTVTWAATDNGSVSPASDWSRSSGEAKGRWTLGSTLGPQSATATVDTLLPATFQAEAVPLNLTIGGFYLTQATQTLSRSVPLVAGRAGYLRVWVTGNGVANVTPSAQVSWYQGGSLVRTDVLPAPGADVVTSLVESPLSRSWNLAVPGSLIQPGLEIVLEADPDDQVLEGDETDNVIPTTGRLPLDVRMVSDLDLTLVPIQQGNGLTGNVTPENRETFLNLTQRIFPLATVVSGVRGVFVTGANLGDFGEGWSTVLSELNALRIAEDGNHYLGVVRVNYGSGTAGIAYVPGRAALTWDRPPSDRVVAHELGHNFGRLHAPCGDPPYVDPSFPYVGGTIGVFGMDVATGTLVSTSTADVMGYCPTRWTSDYTYAGVLSYRAATSVAVGASAAEPSVLIWGRIENGRLVLEPSFPVRTRAALPAAPGPYRVEGLDADGVILFSLSFQGDEVADLPNHRAFAFAVPAVTARIEQLTELRLTDGVRSVWVSSAVAVEPPPPPQALLREAGTRAVRLEWNHVLHPLAVLRDARTGAVLAFGRGGAVVVPTSEREVDVVFSDGVRGTQRRVGIAR